MIRAKTAELFAAACEVGPVLAERPEGRAGRLPLVRDESRHRLPAGRRRARLRRQGSPSSARMSATISARARSRCRWCCRSAAAARAEREFWTRTLEQGEIGDADLDHAIGLMVVVSFLSAYLVVKTFIGFISRFGFAPFAWYRIVVGVAAIALLTKAVVI